MAVKVKGVTDQLERFRAALVPATEALGGVTAANDNPADVPSEIIVNGTRSVEKVLKDTLKDLLKKVFGDKLSAQISQLFAKVFEGAALGQASSGIARSLGLKQSKLGSQIGGAIGNFIPGLPPGVGSAIGGFIGGTIGGLFKKTRKGTLTLSNGGVKRLRQPQTARGPAGRRRRA